MVGREAELSRIDEFLDSPDEGFAILAVEGEPGIGKTTIWREAVRRARAGGYQVLACRPAQSEARLSFVGLVDLLAPVADNALQALPEPQRQVLEVALLRAEAGGRRADQRTVSVAVLSVLRNLATGQAVLVAVDDAQWLDRASAAALEFALRRLEGERVRALTAIRVSDEAIQTFDRVVGERRSALKLGPLSVGSLHEMIKEQLGQTFARPTLIKVARMSGGNPFYALEIARAVRDSGEPRGGEALPLPDDLSKLVHSRIRRLPAESRRGLLEVSALSVPSLEIVDRVTLAAAERAEIVRVIGDDRVEFTHPLFASAVYSSASASERRAVHGRLAELVEDPEERARHLALATENPDEEVAQALEAGAAIARSRGAWGSAAELLVRARLLTPANRPDDAHRRTFLAAEHHVYAGDRIWARRLLEELLSEDLDRPLRCHALHALAQVSSHDENFAEAERLFSQALEYADDPGSAAVLECGLAWVRSNLMDWRGGAAHARRALELAEGTGESGVMAQALAYGAMFGYLDGHGVAWDVVERSLALEDPEQLVPLYWRPRSLAALLTLYVGRLAEARERLLEIRATAIDQGDESDLAFFALWLSWLETLAGNLEEAAALSEESLTLASLTGSQSTYVWALTQRAFVRAHAGDAADTRRDCSEATQLGTFGHALPLQWIAASLAVLELSLGNPQAAWDACESMTQAVEQHGISEPVPNFFLPNALEALIEIGQLDRAEALLDVFESRGRDLDRAWALATGGRCRGLLVASRGDLVGAEEALGQALAQHDRLEMPFERARTLLCLGRVQRRGKQRKAARETLTSAVAIFEPLGARLWAERTQAELERTHVREAPSELTPSEEQVAQLAANGLKNREIAERLYLSPKTVEANLARVYRKLGIRSRAELGSAMSGQAPSRSS